MTKLYSEVISDIGTLIDNESITVDFLVRQYIYFLKQIIESSSIKNIELFSKETDDGETRNIIVSNVIREVGFRNMELTCPRYFEEIIQETEGEQFVLNSFEKEALSYLIGFCHILCNSFFYQKKEWQAFCCGIQSDSDDEDYENYKPLAFDCFEKICYRKSEDNEISSFVDSVIAGNQKAVDDYSKGNNNSLHFLVGQVMKKSKGKADPKLVSSILKEKIKQETTK